MAHAQGMHVRVHQGDQRSTCDAKMSDAQDQQPRLSRKSLTPSDRATGLPRCRGLDAGDAHEQHQRSS